MPIVMVVEGSRTCPTVVCDHCGQVIARGEDGNYQWRLIAGSVTPQPVFFTHKRCCAAFERAQPEQPGWLWAAIPLECFPVYLERTLAIQRQEACEWADMLGTL